MKKITVFMHTGYCGCDSVDVIEVDDDTTDDELHEMVWEMAVDHAASYGQEMCTDDCEDEECQFEHPGSTNIEGHWEVYDADKHDSLVPGGV